MAPKALTDCPENLREAIDWLVQVQHCGGTSTLSGALSALFDNVAQDAEKSLPSLPDPDRPSARDVVSKLRAFQSTLPKDSANPNKNIIHNLCASAASLLGHRFPGTYDGSGIVYGNASRLCDAILAFLYAVFSDVHDNQPYVAGRSILYDDVIVQLKSQLWRGRKGLCQAIPKVANGLRDYNAAVRASNDRVKEPIETVLEYVNPGGELRNGIHALQITEASTPFQDEQTVSTAVSLVEQCKAVARVFSKSLTAAKDAIDDLNPKLKRTLENARNSFFNHVDWLSKWSKKGQKERLDKMVHKIKSRLKKLANAVKDKIKQEVHTVVELLKKRVREIRMKLEGITASLEKYVTELGTWMGEAKKYINDVKKYVNDIMEQLNGENKKKIDEAAGEIDRVLSQKVEALKEWIEDAENAVNVAKEKADEVYEKLNHGDDQQLIASGIKQIKAARENVSKVDKGLQTVNDDFEKWREAAETVLTNAVTKAVEVHKQLDPYEQGDGYPIGTNIQKIGDAKKELDEANTALRDQINHLNTWIQDAEKIRAAAETKAREAYDKLKVKKELSENVKKIMDAKDRIKEVHKAVETQVKELERWKDQAEEVIGGAVEKAKQVHDALDIGDKGKQLTKQFEGIEQANQSIQAANKTLEDNVGYLGKWKQEAEKVINKADEKCDEILRRVDKNYKGNQSKGGPVILQEASKLKDQGTKLLKAASESKQQVEEKVKLALEAVKEMDSDLKKDLFDVKTKIKQGITEVISTLQVNKLGERVREDLVKLRERIGNLKGEVNKNEKNGGTLVKKELDALDQAKHTLTEESRKIKEQKLKEMGEKFESEIKRPLNKEVKKVEEAIGKLYNTVSGGTNESRKHIKDVIGHIKGKVGNIMTGADGNKGLLGIEKGFLQSYAGGFKGDQFKEIVKGWVSDSILKFNGLVWDKMEWHMQTNDNVFTNIAVEVRNKLTDEINKGKEALKGSAQRADRKITEILTQVKQACEKFADALDNQATQFVRGKVTGIVDKVKEVSELKGKGGPHSLTAAEAVLCALSTASRQVSKEIHSILLDKSRVGKAANTSIAEELDRVIGVTQDLDGKLGQATQTSDDGTAQAVDNAIEGVTNMVGSTIEIEFENKVKKPVEQAVKGLDTAVDAYDNQAKEQVREAAKKAIDEAAKKISKNGGSDIDLGSTMGNFHEAHENIKNSLVKHLQEKADKFIGTEDTTDGAQRDQKVELSDEFKKYGKHITQPVDSSTDPTGNVPKAINSIKSDGLKGLEIIGNGDGKIESKTFDKPVSKIEEELKDIKKLVSQSGFFGRDDKGVKNLLDDLRNGLDSGTLDGTSDKGLNNIQSGIDGLLKGTFVPKPDGIGKAVTEIKLKVDELKKKLKHEREDDKDPVINALTHFQKHGLASETWNGKDGRQVGGLRKIEDDLRKQNEELGKQTKEIGEAFDYTIKELKGMLGQVGLRLHNIIVPDDVMDNLRKLKVKIGKNGDKYSDSLENIYDDIKKLQEDPFNEIPNALGQAKTAMEEELKRLRGVLEGDKEKDVVNALKDLRDVGLGSGDWKKEQNTKGLEKIENELKGQQTTLTQQHEEIDLGVNVITKELCDIRSVLEGKDGGIAEDRGILKNIDFIITNIGTKADAGLRGINKVIDSLNTNTVPVITDKLSAMCHEITTAAGQLGLNLHQLEDPHIDKKLKGIQSGLTNLRLTDLAAAIKMCDDFLIKADEIEQNTIDALLKHVDDEVYDAINDLTKEARGLYVDSVREALELFAKKVNEDLEQLPNEINRDRYVGYKGFMKYLQGPLGSDLTGEEQSVAELSSAFQEVFEQIEKYVKGEITRLHDEQNKEKNPALPPTEEPYTSKLNDVYKALTALLAYLRDNDGGTDRLTELVERLSKALGNLAPSDFKHPSTPLLDTVSIGLTKFAGEFGNCYISAYSGQRCREEHSHKYARVLLSMIPITHDAVTKLMMKCESDWKHLHISKFTADERDNALGNYLTRCGYRVSGNYAVQDGELNNMFTGAGIHELLTTSIEDVAVQMLVDGEPIKNGINLVHIISLLYNTLCHYFQVCHIPVPPNPRYPCTVRDMLSWLSGLQYTQVADKLPDHCKALLNRRCHDGDTPNREDPVMAKCIGELPLTIASACSHSTALLTAIQGNGHGFDLAAYPYSVDFSNNRARLHYPNDPAELLDMLREIACRLCKVLYFLYSQCCRSTVRVKGWRECAYGRQIQSHNWQCEQFGTQSVVSSITTSAATTIISTTTHGCPPTSPLQSFLSDCCHGLLPHTLTAADMAIECANCVANQPGQQCLTPLGFWDLGFAASISGTGWDLAKRLGDMCRDADSCLFVLCRTLSLLCPAAPSSLADVFALYAQMLRQWDPHDRVRHLGGTYTDASNFISHLNADGIDSLFPLWTQLHGSYENNKLTTAIASLAGDDHKNHNALSTLFYDSTCKPPSGCAPYLQPLGLHARHTYPKKHAGLYITWIMHLAWQFWELLTHLLHALDNIDCTASGCATCPCQPGTHGEKDTCQCPSIIQCAGPLPTLYRYGFKYRNANLLVTDKYAIHCGDLNTQLKEALHSGHFTELFRQIDQLIWHIRMPFLYFLIALWTITALYILHTFFYRMDILRIRSHLPTTKASHLIDVKALLIPSRKMLSLYDASYFDDDPNELLNLR